MPIITLNLTGTKRLKEVETGLEVTAPTSLVVSPYTHVQKFNLRTIEHQVTLDGLTYKIEAFDFNWLYSGIMTFAKVNISSKSFSVYSNGRMALTYKGATSYSTDEMLGYFANSGYSASRRLVDSCLFTIANQVLEIERELKSR